MNLDLVLQEIDKRVFSKTNRHLKEVESIVLQGAWQGKTYEQMEETCQYSLSYLKQAAGPRLWKLLSEVLQENIGKTNFRVVLERQWDRQNFPIEPNRASFSPQNETVQKPDWGEAPEVNVLYGRDRELESLKEWILQNRCRLVTVFGMAGIGKTALAIYFAQENQVQFDKVIWRSLHYASGAAELVSNLLQFFEPQTTQVDLNLDRQISVLLEHLRQNRCLIVLDTAAEIWQRGDLAGHYRQQYKGYGELVRRLGTESHQSCLLLCTREKPREVARLEGEKVPVHSLHLTGLSSQAELIFEEKQLSDPKKWNELIELYRGNPLALKIVATTIQELFGGSVATFLQQDTIVYGDIYDLLDEQFEYLSVLEREILNWLAIAFKPLSLVQLRENILLPIEMAELIEALESLIRRSLIIRMQVKGKTVFSSHQPIVGQYAISRLIDNIYEEIESVNEVQDTERIEFLRNYALVTQDAKIDKYQQAQIVIPLKNKLYRIFRDEKAIETCLQAILRSLRGKSPLSVGYTKHNIEILLENLRSDLINASR